MPKYINFKCLFFLLLFLSLIECGIPGLHKWLINNFPSCVKIVHKNNLLDINNLKKNLKINTIKKKENIFEVDNLLFDLNQLLHKANVKFTNFDNYFFKLTILIKNVLKKFPPNKNVIFAIDGICPFSKLKLQIKRRAKVKSQENENVYLCENDKYINDITCGSTFINKISCFLVNFVKYLSSLQKYENVKFFISTDKEIGEGELKLMNWINNYVYIKKKEEEKKNNENNDLSKIQRENNIFDKNNKKNYKNVEEESFVIVGADADLLLQCLALKNIHNIFIYTYQTFNINICDNKNKKENHLIEYEKKNFMKDNKDGLIDNLKKKNKKMKVLYNLNTFINLFLNKYPQSFEFIKRDLLILFILKGNDYLPKIKEGNFSIFFEAYFRMLEKIKKIQNEETYSGFLNTKCMLNKNNFLKFLNEVEKIINFSNFFLNYNNEDAGNNNTNKYMKNIKENNYLPLSFLNELISKHIIKKDDIKIEIINEKDLYKCTIIYFKNNEKYYYSATSKKKKKSMHIAAYNFLKDNFSSYIEFINLKPFDSNEKETNNINNINYKNSIKNNNSYLEEERENLYEKIRENKINDKIENNKTNNETQIKEIYHNSNNKINKTKFNKSNEKCNLLFNKNHENEDMRLKLYLTKIYEEKYKNKINYEEEKKIVENYIQGIHWVIDMYTKTYCINFNFFYKYLFSPSLLSLYYHLSRVDKLADYNSDYRNAMKNMNLNIFKNNYEYYNFINFCINKYNKLKLNALKNVLCDEEKEKNKKDSLIITNRNQIKFFENIYDILFAKDINIVKDSIKKLNTILKSISISKKVTNYYWNIYAQKLKKFYKIIFYKGTKIYISKFSLFKVGLGIRKNNNYTYMQKFTKNDIYNMNKEKLDSEIDNFDNSLNNFKKGRIFCRNSLYHSNKRKIEKKIIKRKYIKVVYR
ncbi:conserved Plasmodium protein, unknown function [Plasmodium gallinaceum]|uniref:Xrn1 N-terminal domain-containing protein n=1 Tax=Plasmodium gallinaceum TaxID=5849 RepID=A0A1J1GSL4_PLAGA|nr:conserved Plasmodium protein, unknown function [Plasmodium gallinaceum]CRG95428.1 conserved Plasmodium protein, unknown function [Plasmodium gallinaceum]